MCDTRDIPGRFYVAPCLLSLLLIIPPVLGYSQSVMVGDVRIAPEDFSADLDPEKRIEKCTMCHGKYAGGDIDFGPDVHFGTPALRGMREIYLKESLLAYKTGDRMHPEMTVISAMLDEETVDFMARAFAAYQPPPMKSADELETLVKKDPLFKQGWDIAQGGIPSKGVPACATCHGALGKGGAGLGPRLAAQNALYVESQFKAFASGARKTAQAGVMQSAVVGMTLDDVKAVAHYYQSIAQVDQP
jgi:cytochrome c553